MYPESSVQEHPLFEKETRYIDHSIVTFDSSGGACSLDNCTLTIPEGAIPKDKVIVVKIGVSISTPLTSFLPQGLRLVSPIVQLCTLFEPKFKFLKPVTIEIQHFLSTQKKDIMAMNLHFLKSDHNLPHFHKIESDGKEVFTTHTQYGTLKIDHFCSFCIAGDKNIIDASCVYYYLMRVVPKEIVGHKWNIIYCVVLETCTKVTSYVVHSRTLQNYQGLNFYPRL